MQTRFILKILIFLLLIPVGCRRDRFKVPASFKSPDIKIERFENDLFTMDLGDPQRSVDTLFKQYGHFMDLFGYLIHIGEPDDPRFADFLVQFVTDRTNDDVYNKVKKTFADLHPLEKELTHAFRRYFYYFGKPAPQVLTYISGFNASIVIDTNILGIGLDRYLGSDFPYYTKLGIPHYMVFKMKPEKIPSDCLYAWLKTEFEFNGSGDGEISDNVINNILYEGKLVFLVKALLPDEELDQILGFTTKQMDWCNDNELDMWTFLIEHKLLFKTDRLTVRKFTGEAPFTSLFPRESPGRAAVWMGYRIILSYMNNHPEVTLQNLMAEKDFQKILNQAKYDPK